MVLPVPYGVLLHVIEGEGTYLHLALIDFHLFRDFLFHTQRITSYKVKNFCLLAKYSVGVDIFSCFTAEQCYLLSKCRFSTF